MDGKGARAGRRAVVRGEVVGFGACCVSVAGEVHVVTIDELTHELQRMRSLGCRQLILDLSRSTAVEPVARALLELARALRTRRAQLAVVCSEPGVAAVLAEHGVAVTSTLAEARKRFALAADA